MRELTRSFSKLAQQSAAPAARGKTSGCLRKKFAIIRASVGSFIGADVLRALLALGEPNTCHNVVQLQHVAERGLRQRADELNRLAD